MVGDFDGDGRDDEMVIRIGQAGEQTMVITFATGATARNSWRQGSATAFRLLPASQLANFCKSEGRSTCPQAMTKRDAFTFVAEKAGLTAVGVWTGTELLLIAGATTDHHGRPFLADAVHTPAASTPTRASAVPSLGTLTDLRLGVDASGFVKTCTVAKGSGSATLDQSACAIMSQKGRFHPATDSTGKPVSSLNRLRVRWNAAGTPTTITPIP
jgi:TonB family protein